MKRFYVLTIVDVQNFGYNPKDILIFDDKEKAQNKMKELYLSEFKKYYNDGVDAFATDNYGYEISNDYAYISGYYYLDIFNKDIEV